MLDSLVLGIIGGLLSGALVYGLAPETEGRGTATVVKALDWNRGTIRARVAPVKMLASAITISSGGAAGREGPTALIAAGFGSMYATWLKRPEREKRLIVLMGMAACLSAIFRSPIGTAIFAGQSVVLARPNTILQPGDRLLLVIQPEGIQHLSHHLGPAAGDPVPA